MSDDDWFLPKRFGYGAGLPIAWQGWALLGGYLAVLMALTQALAERHLAEYLVVVVVMTVALMVIAARHTRGGWRWRWGGDA